MDVQAVRQWLIGKDELDSCFLASEIVRLAKSVYICTMSSNHNDNKSKTIYQVGGRENLYNSNFNCTEFDTIKNAADNNNFVLSVKNWIQRTWCNRPYGGT